MKISFNNVEIDYEIHRKKVKNMTLRVKTDGRVIITANNRVSTSQIEAFIVNKADWILSKLDKVNSSIKLGWEEILVKHNESFHLLGIDYKFILIKDTNYGIKLKDNTIEIYCKEITDKEVINRIFRDWLKSYTKDVMDEVLLACMKRFELLIGHKLSSSDKVTKPILKIRKMKSRWGSCMVNKRTITMNAYLIHTPLACIEMVMYHELAHFIHPNHSRDFYNTLSILLPDHRERSKDLNRYVLV